MARWRSKIETMALLPPASTVCLWVEFPPATVRLAEKKLQRSIEQTQYITPPRREIQTAELVVNRELMM